MEDFTPIKSYETYGVNKIGQVKCLRTGNIVPQFDTGGYKRLNLRNPDGYKCFLAHRLVALTFIENPNNLDEVDHIDRNRSNNHIDNLRWSDDIIQNNNKCGWGKYPKYISFDNSVPTKKNPYNCWVFQVRSKIYGNHKKRFKTCDYTVDDAIKYRNKWFLENHNIILD